MKGCLMTYLKVLGQLVDYLSKVFTHAVTIFALNQMWIKPL